MKALNLNSYIYIYIYLLSRKCLWESSFTILYTMFNQDSWLLGYNSIVSIELIFKLSVWDFGFKVRYGAMERIWRRVYYLFHFMWRMRSDVTNLKMIRKGKQFSRSIILITVMSTPQHAYIQIAPHANFWPQLFGSTR